MASTILLRRINLTGEISYYESNGVGFRETYNDILNQEKTANKDSETNLANHLIAQYLFEDDQLVTDETGTHRLTNSGVSETTDRFGNQIQRPILMGIVIT